MIAQHSQLVTNDVEEYLSQFDYQVPFGLDTTGEILLSFNGSTMLSQTVVIDTNVIMDNHPDMMFALSKKAVSDWTGHYISWSVLTRTAVPTISRRSLMRSGPPTETRLPVSADFMIQETGKRKIS